MAVGSFSSQEAGLMGPVVEGPGLRAGEFVWRAMRAAGSLKITVVSFLAATFLLFVGTLAQDEKNLPEVKQEYFNSWEETVLRVYMVSAPGIPASRSRSAKPFIASEVPVVTSGVGTVAIVGRLPYDCTLAAVPVDPLVA